VLDAAPSSSGSPGVDLAGTVMVQLADQTSSRAGDHGRLVALVARLTGADPTTITLSQVCPNCAQSGHGPLRVAFDGPPVGPPAGMADSTPDPAPTVHVSLTRAGGRLGLAVTAAGPVGIDLESVAELGRAAVADAVLSDAEARALAHLRPAKAGATMAVLWTAKEAVLKAAGTGLRVDPRELTVALPSPGFPTPTSSPGGTAGRPGCWPLLDVWPAAPFPLGAVHLHQLTVPAGTVGTVAVVSGTRPALVLLPNPTA
jgi:4'-phosphopantetheinyl transferase